MLWEVWQRTQEQTAQYLGNLEKKASVYDKGIPSFWSDVNIVKKSDNE